jgi:hypothetical protein
MVGQFYVLVYYSNAVYSVRSVFDETRNLHDMKRKGMMLCSMWNACNGIGFVCFRPSNTSASSWERAMVHVAIVISKILYTAKCWRNVGFVTLHQSSSYHRTVFGFLGIRSILPSACIRQMNLTFHFFNMPWMSDTATSFRSRLVSDTCTSTLHVSYIVQLFLWLLNLLHRYLQTFSCSPILLLFSSFLFLSICFTSSGVPRGVGVNPPPRNSEVLTKLSQIPSFVEYTSVTTYSEYGFHSFANWLEPRLGGYRPQIPVLPTLCPQLNLLNPLPEKIPGYATVY